MCNESTLFTELHKRDVDVTISSIATRSKGSASNAMEKAARQLFQVVKDHKNEMVLQMCEESNLACYATSAATSDEEESSQPITHPIHYSKLLCRIVVVNEMDYYVKLHDTTTNLSGDGMWYVGNGKPRPPYPQ